MKAWVLGLILSLLGLLIWVALALVILVPGLQPPLTPAATELTPTKEITIYLGEVNNEFAFGFSPEDLSVPGPDIIVDRGDVVKIILINIGEIPHSFGVGMAPQSITDIVFEDSEIPGSRAIPPGGESEVVFIANQAGEFYYICTVPGHPENGMWGRFIVNP